MDGGIDASSAQTPSGMSIVARSIVLWIRAALDMPTIVFVIRGSRRENCNAAAASGTPCRSQMAAIWRTRSIIASDACW